MLFNTIIVVILLLLLLLLLCCIGSGGTGAGIALGMKLSGMMESVRFHAFNVCDEPITFWNDIDSLIYEKMNAPYKARDIVHIVEGYIGRGYGISSREELELVHQVASRYLVS